MLVVSTLFSKYYDFNLVVLDCFFFLCDTKTPSYNIIIQYIKTKKILFSFVIFTIMFTVIFCFYCIFNQINAAL